MLIGLDFGLTMSSFSPSMASIHAARIHSLLLTFTDPPAPPTPTANLDLDTTLHQLNTLPLVPFDEFTLGIEGSTAGTLFSSLDSVDSGQSLGWDWEGWNFNVDVAPDPGWNV